MDGARRLRRSGYDGRKRQQQLFAPADDLQFSILRLSPSCKLYPPVCKPYGLEAELEAGGAG